MISARRAALLGLTVPLSAIMLAVLGLWPEEDEEEVPPPIVFGGGGGRFRPGRTAPQPRAVPRWDAEADRVREAWDAIDALRFADARAVDLRALAAATPATPGNSVDAAPPPVVLQSQPARQAVVAPIGAPSANARPLNDDEILVLLLALS